MILLDTVKSIPGIKIMKPLLKSVYNNFLPDSTKLWLYKSLEIDHSKILQLIENFDQSGVTSTKRSTKLIVSLTSYPARMNEIHFTLYSLFNQSVKPDEIVLWLGEEKFPQREHDIPKEVLIFKKFGLQILFCTDLKPHTKLIPALSMFPDDIIVTSDDDAYYDKDWLKILYHAYQSEPTVIHCHWGRHIPLTNSFMIKNYDCWRKALTMPSYRNFALGIAGVIYPPHSLHTDVFRNDLFTKLCPTNDDIWFWAMSVLNGTKIRMINTKPHHPLSVNLKRDLGLIKNARLHEINTQQKRNDIQIKAVTDYYPEIIEKLINDNNF
jgi:hypothetical protein